eukprot:13335306-Alexandrium_andersonii.AAC.1
MGAALTTRTRDVIALAWHALNLVTGLPVHSLSRCSTLKAVALAHRGGACGRSPPAWPLGAPGRG